MITERLVKGLSIVNQAFQIFERDKCIPRDGRVGDSGNVVSDLLNVYKRCLQSKVLNDLRVLEVRVALVGQVAHPAIDREVAFNHAVLEQDESILLREEDASLEGVVVLEGAVGEGG